MFQISAGQLFVWIVIGGLAGAVTGILVRQNRRGYGIAVNIIIGMAGAFIGGLLFDLLNIAIAPEIQFSLNDLIAAIVGSLILVLVLGLVKRYR